jgi:acetylornithine/succinyldiaminopimelate/putrescine aminotransferase
VAQWQQDRLQKFLKNVKEKKSWTLDDEIDCGLTGLDFALRKYFMKPDIYQKLRLDALKLRS